MFQVLLVNRKLKTKVMIKMMNLMKRLQENQDRNINPPILWITQFLYMNLGFKVDPKARNFVAFSSFISTLEPKNVKEDLKDADFVISMQEELHQFKRRKVWRLVLRPPNKTITRARWVFKTSLINMQLSQKVSQDQ